MKNITTLLIVLWCVSANGQNDTIKYDSTQSLTYCSKISNWTSFGAYVSKDGSILRIGDTLKIGKPSTNTNQFTYLWFGKYSTGKAILSKPVPLHANYQAEVVVVTDIFALHEKAFNKNSTLIIWLYLKNPHISNLGSNRTNIGYEKAIELKEIINPNAALTREQAIAKLKEAKDLVDLGMMTESEFNELKEKLKPIIAKQ